MYFVIATMALGYTSTASAVKLSDVNGHTARIANTADDVPCAVCTPKTASDFNPDTNEWNEWWGGFVDDPVEYEREELGCARPLEDMSDYIFSVGTKSELYGGKSYDCTDSGWVLSGPVYNGTYDNNNGTIYDGVSCTFDAEGSSWQCASCSSVSCNDGYYGDPTGCAVRLNDCLPCPVSTYKTAIGDSGNYTCTTILQPGQSTAGSNRTISGCKIPKLVGGSGGAYCNDNGFFIWDSACSYAG